MKKRLLSFYSVVTLVCFHCSVFAAYSDNRMAELPVSIQEWFKETKDLNALRFEQMYPNQLNVNRQEVATDCEIRKISFSQAEKFYKIANNENLDCLDLKPKIHRLRVNAQPNGSIGQRPADTNAPKDMAAFHNGIGIAEIVCSDLVSWKTSLQEHFDRVSKNQTK